MDPVFLGLKAPELVAVLTGAFGLYFSLQAYKRAKTADERSERAEARAETAETRAENSEARAKRAEDRSVKNEERSLELAITTEKHNILLDIRNIRTASDRRRWKIRMLRLEAETHGLASAVEAAAELDQLEVIYAQPLDEIEQLVQPIEPKRASHEVLVQLRETISLMVKERIATEKLDEDMNETNIEELRKNIELLKLQKGTAPRESSPGESHP